MRPPTDEEIVTLALEVRDALPRLLGDGWRAVDVELERLLAGQDTGESDADELLLVLTADEVLREWVAERLDADEHRGRWARVRSGDDTAAAYAHLECPATVLPEVEFEVVVGLSPESQVGIADEAMIVPAGDYVLSVDVIAPGLVLREGEAWQFELPILSGDRYPTVVLHLTAPPDVERSVVKALYAIDGQVLGCATRVIEVGESATHLDVERGPSISVSVPPAEFVPDVTLSILYAGEVGGGRLRWKVHSPHLSEPIPVLDSDTGEDARAIATRLVRELQADADATRTGRRLRGLGRKVAKVIPRGVWDAVHTISARVPDRPLRCLLLTEEPYVPWELASVNPVLNADAPEHLCTQVVLGRWVLSDGTGPPPPQPQAAFSAHTMAVVTSREQDLDEAALESARLASRFGALEVVAREEDVFKLLEEGDPAAADIIHFAVHGRYDPGGTEGGLQLDQRGRLTDLDILGIALARPALVFINACEIGSSELMLGQFSGLAASFLRAGAIAVVAPLWAVDDAVSRDVSEQFYRRVLDDGALPAEVLMNQRRRIEDAELPTPTPLAYQFFGHPHLRIERAAT